MSTHLKRVYFVRHGQTIANRTRTVQGPEDPLSEEGLRQVEKIAERASHIDFDVLYASDLKRAQQTAHAITARTGHDINPSSLFREIALPSSLIDLPRDSNEYRTFVAEAAEHYHAPEWRVEDGETFLEARERANKALALIAALDARSVLVVSHGHFIRLMLAQVIMQGRLEASEWREISKSFYMHNTGVSIIREQESTDEHPYPWRLVTLNDFAHLAE